MPHLSKRRKRITENASASRIAEADDVWHSTAIEESTGDNFAPLVDKEQSSKKKSGPAFGSSKGAPKDSGYNGRPTDKDVRDDESIRVSPSPIVINPPSGHAFVSGVLQRCGYIIRQPNSNNEMFYDVMLFRKKMADWLRENDDEMSRIETDASKFLKALNAYLSEKPNFVSSMKPTKHETELIQPSLLHCLLGIDILQPHVLKIVMPILGEASFSLLEEDVAFVNTILNQLKWLPMIVDGQKFADNLLAIIDTSVFTCQCQMIKLISDIVPSNLHPQIAEKLLEKFSEDKRQLNIALMDCFSSLDIPEGFWSNIRNTAIDQMTSADLKDIPAYFSFLFRVESVVALTDVITTIREKVDLIPKDKNPKNDAYQVEILEKVGFCITVNPVIVNIWIKQVKDDIRDVADSIRSIDLIMLLVFADSHKAAASVLKSLFAEKNLAVRLFSEMMQHNLAMVYQLFSTIVKFIDSFLRSRDAKCLDAVCEITGKLFLGLSALEAQTLMGNMTTILINYPPSRDVVLQILTNLSEKNPKKLLLFAPYLMGVLEYVMQFPARQIRSLMNVLAILSQTEGRSGESNHFTAEFSILLRKQLTHSDIKIRCFGVFGALATIRQLARQDDPNEARIKELLKLAWDFVERDEDACGIFFDELSSCVMDIPVDICRDFRDTLKGKFESLWTIDQFSQSQFIQYGQRKSLILDMVFDANKECSQDRLVIIFENQALQMSPLVVPALLRVLAFLETKVESELVGIDAILGCPILFPKLEYYRGNSITDFSYNQRLHLGHYLVMAINFFRESVCAFVADSDPELRVKIWLRLENILQLQKSLVSHFDYFPSLPLAYVAEKTIGSKDKDGAGPSGFNSARMREVKPVKPTASKTKTKTTKKSTKKKARREFSDSESEVEEVSNAAVPKKVVLKVNPEEDIQPKKILPHLRRFDIQVFQLLRCPLNCQASDSDYLDFSNILADLSCVSQNPHVIKRVEMFNPDSLALLLLELRDQVNDERCKLDILSIKNLLKYICKHISSIVENNEEQEAQAESEVITTTELQKKLECCLRLLINIMASYFDAIKKFDKDGKEAMIEKSLNSLARQVNHSDGVGSSSQLETTTSVANYLGGFYVTIKDPATALDHIKLLQIIHDLRNGHPTIKKAIDDATSHYLKCDWKLSSIQVDGFLKIWLGTTPSSIKVIKHLVTKLMTHENETELDLSEVEQKLPNSAVYKSCSNTNFHTWYCAMLRGLSQYVYKNLRRRGDFEDSIEQWVEAVDIFKDLVAVTKKMPKNLILVSLLKHCRVFLDAFITGGAELLPEYWKREKELAQAFCKGLQVPCRTIQHICEHSKINTDMQLLKSVPLVKRVLETLVFRVREVLGVQGAANAFWMGNLKHRDLQGDCINSQIIDDNDIDLISSDDESDIGEALLSGRNEQLGGSAHFDENSMDVDVLEASGDEFD
ncbi:unnamed protein product [Orchesella dallaii]|uniref:Fanconi anemia group D2 protein n=1 Tax=Orchesella dallaii TaxID=48710 RepID=A0ABP1QBT9_9HEXA